MYKYLYTIRSIYNKRSIYYKDTLKSVVKQNIYCAANEPVLFTSTLQVGRLREIT